jgi:simple sugar transport system ATP-binding protein
VERPWALEAAGIVKRYPGVIANDGVNLRVAPGEIHGVLGENGAGKSTLMNILSGLARADAGEIRLEGKRVVLESARDGLRRGIAMVHQHFMLIPALTVAENAVLGLGPGWRLDLAAAARDVEAIARRYGFDIDPYAYVWQLSVGQMQRVEIIKALIRGARILILDEPTAVLIPAEVDALARVLIRLRAEGKSVVFISHKLNEVFQICDRVTVLRGGHDVGSFAVSEVTPGHLARLMVGHDVPQASGPDGGQPGHVVLSVGDLHVAGDRGTDAVTGVSLDVRSGEIFGIAGVDGNGQRELVEALIGLRPVRRGTVSLFGDRLRHPWRPGDLLSRGVGFIPDDRQRDGLLLRMTVAENLVCSALGRAPLSRRGWLQRSAVDAEARRLILEYNIRVSGVHQVVGELSGGNQQRIVLARALAAKPRLLLAVQPTRGLDIAATGYVHQRLRAAQKGGCAVLLISTELDEVLALANRVGVIYRGRIVGTAAAAEADRETIGAWMAGLTPGAGGIRADTEAPAAIRRAREGRRDHG